MGKELEIIKSLFAKESRPKNFTNYTHCDECNEHNETLKKYDRNNLPTEVLSNQGWDPICFITPEGYRYYYPRLCELAYGAGDNYYLEQFLFHLENHMDLLTHEEKDKTYDLLLDISSVLSIEIERNLTSPDLNRISEKLR